MTTCEQAGLRVREVEAVTVKEWLDSGSAILIDVRERDEHAREHIAGARLVPLSHFDPSAVGGPAGATIVLHCKSGRRSAEAAARMPAAIRGEVVCLKGGIDAWKAGGLPTRVDRKAPTPIMRQVQLVVGGAVLVTSVLAAAVTPWFLLLTGFFGAGLLFAGATGTCGMAAALGRMPWNRGPRCDAACRATSRAGSSKEQ